MSIVHQTEIEDALLPELVAQGVHAAVKSAARGGLVEAKEITRFVHDQLQELSCETDKSFEDDLKQRARTLTDALQKHPRFKDNRRIMEEFAQKEQAQNEQIARLESENESLRRTLRGREEQLRDATDSDSGRFKAVLDAVRAAEQRFGSDLLFHEKGASIRRRLTISVPWQGLPGTQHTRRILEGEERGHSNGPCSQCASVSTCVAKGKPLPVLSMRQVKARVPGIIETPRSKEP